MLHGLFSSLFPLFLKKKLRQQINLKYYCLFCFYLLTSILSLTDSDQAAPSPSYENCYDQDKRLLTSSLMLMTYAYTQFTESVPRI